MNKLGPSYFDNYFCKINHNYATRRNNSSVVISKVKTESGKRSFRFQGALVTRATCGSTSLGFGSVLSMSRNSH